MDKMNKEKVKKRLKEGWIRSWMMVEVLATTKSTAEKALEVHIDKIAKENKTEIVQTEFHETKEVEKPLPNVEKGYSCVVEIEMLTENYDKLVYLVMNYGPSAVEILEPKELRIGAGEAQGILNSVSEMIHKFAAAGIGGLVINKQ